jgi:signal transduction histidine kinase
MMWHSARTRNWAIDGGIAVAVTAFELCAFTAHGWHSHGHVQPSAWGYLPVIIGGLALLARRRFPVPVLAVTLGAALWGAALGMWTVWLALCVAFVTAVLERERAAAIVSLVVGYVVSVWPPWLIGSSGHTSTAQALGLLAGLAALMAGAELLRARRQRAIDLASRREEESRRRASEERLSIARDLHDVIAHNISVINVQANTALHLMDRQPERAREALTAIHDVSKQALSELRSVLGVMRSSDGEGAPLAPSPGLDRLGELAAGTAGINVQVVTDGPPRPVPAGVDVAAYRIVQEALTNTVRHSGGSAATVRLRYEDQTLTISVDDNGRARVSAPAGNGMAGMAERARALGGTLEAGPRPGGGFRVLARLPAAREAGSSAGEAGSSAGEAGSSAGEAGSRVNEVPA